jgi:hypothetical protein
MNQGGGRFARLARGPWDDDRACEDTAGLWLDVDGDGDLDLYVASGSNEWEEGSPFLRDRLYLNEGGSRFPKCNQTGHRRRGRSSSFFGRSGGCRPGRKAQHPGRHFC